MSIPSTTSPQHRGIWLSAVRTMKETKLALKKNGEFSPIMEKLFYAYFHETLTDESLPRRVSHELCRRYPDECKRLSDVYFSIVCPHIMDNARERYINTLPLYKRTISKVVGFINRPAVMKVTYFGSLLTIGAVFFLNTPLITPLKRKIGELSFLEPVCSVTGIKILAVAALVVIVVRIFQSVRHAS